ncbi:methyl-accepting chemotaxis protein [Aliivibrio fischeri]|uniref:methyl-accepting chemotaxis protein n=1 Tax=Aliivibrio fischeri TaxID=668 RepID=UPI0012DAC50C|nr:methyl-accepting chemotaxis protein [Aliivibrio fischeri]MUK42921.1 HAMP domain-containing protein [Aliivibrio fischeri]
MYKNISIKNKLTLMFVVVILVMASIQTYMTGKQLMKETHRSVEQFSLAITQSSIAGIEKWIDGKVQILLATEKSFSYSDKPISYFAQAEKAGQFDIAYAGLSTGEFYQSRDLPIPDDYDPRTRDWYLAAQNSSDPIVTSPYMDAGTGNLVVTIADSFNTDNYAGVIGADIGIQSIVADVLAVNQDGVSAYLVDKDGHFVAHQDHNMLQKSVSTLSDKLSVAGIEALSKSGSLSEAVINGKDVFIIVAKETISGWYFVTIIDKEHAFASVRSVISDSLFMVMLQLIIIAALAAYLIKQALSPLTLLSKAMEDLSKGEGDLTQRITVDSKDEIGQLAGHVNAFIDKLHLIIKDIASSSLELNSQSRLSTQMAGKTSEGLAIQVNEITQIAAAVHEMSATAQEVANNAQLTAESAVSSTESCEQGKQVIIRNQESIVNLANQVDNASNIIQELESNAQQINTILSTIREIAEQTNLLALNAAIEAARAGEQGRGFAVVADEVRVLSQRTHSSTDEIRHMIETLQRNTHSAVQSMDESKKFAQSSVDDASNATTALEEISYSIQQISDMAMQISNAAAEQRTVTDEVNQNIQSASDVSDQMSTEANNSQQLSEELREIATRLNNQVNLFKY